MWDSYKRYSKDSAVDYDDDLILNSIKETHNIAHNRIESFLPDNTVRLPDFVVPAGFTAAQALSQLCFEGLREFSLQG